MVFKEDDVIYYYSRQDAIKDGVLIDVNRTAKEAGFSIPVVMTLLVYKSYVVVPENVTGQDLDGRLWDILQMLRYEIKTGDKSQSQLSFKLSVKNGDTATTVTLKAICGPDDDGKPCITIMMPEED